MMRARCLLSALLFLLAVFRHESAFAQLSTRQAAAERDAVALRDAALADATAYRLVEELTTRFGPRLAGSEAERASAEWLAGQWRALGFGNVRIQGFPVTAWHRNAEWAAVTAPFPQRLAATALGGSPATPAAGIEGEVAIFDTLHALRDAPAGSLRGRIAMLNYRMPRLQSGAGYNLATAGRSQGPPLAARAGAAAFVMRSAGTDAERSPHAGLSRDENGRVPLPSFALSAMDANQIERLAARGTVRVRLFSSATAAPARSQNVIAEIRGREEPGTIVLIGAHLDSWDLGTGAVDDAAGIGIVSAAAKLIRDLPRQPRRTIRIVAFGAEEASQPIEPFGLFGAWAYANHVKAEVRSHLVASESDLGAGRIYGLDLPAGAATADFGQQVGRVLLPLGILVEAELPPHGGADMLPLQNQGVPVFLLKQDATEYFDLHHTDRDTFDKIRKTDIDQNIAAWAALIWLIAEGDVDFRKSAAPLAP